MVSFICLPLYTQYLLNMVLGGHHTQNRYFEEHVKVMPIQMVEPQASVVHPVTSSLHQQLQLQWLISFPAYGSQSVNFRL